MVFAALQSLLCCYHQPEEAEPDEPEEIIYDETSHLIPHIIEVPVVLIDEEYERQRLRHERLSNIVRSSGGKMVNLGARLPFNLHNQVLPPESRSGSHSGNRSVSPYDDSNYYDLYEENARKEERRLRRIQADAGNRSLSPGAGSSTGEDTGPKIQVTATRLLGIRLVGQEEVRNMRGRTTERFAEPSGLPTPNGSDVGGLPTTPTDGAEVAEATPTQQFRAVDTTFKIQDVGPLIVNWD